MPVIPGQCALCPQPLFQEIRGRRIFVGKEVMFILDDMKDGKQGIHHGSKMKVALCLNCAGNLKPEDHQRLMTEVVAGWEVEMKEGKWNDKDKESYRKRFHHLSIRERHT